MILFHIEIVTDPLDRRIHHLARDHRCNADDERGKIKLFCEKNEKALLSFDAFDKVNTPEINVFLEGPVFDSRGYHRKRSEDVFAIVHDGSGIERVSNLLLTFYQVRCNLFHGQKTLRCERDIELVEKSSVLLQGYLDAVFKYNKDKSFVL